MLIDTHCHPHLGNSCFKHAASALIAATREADWDLVKHYDGGPVCARAYGVHPWWAGSADGEWLESLRSRLEGDQGAICGEIGLDGLRGGAADGTVDTNAQDDVFHSQLALAAELRRPCTVHCVKAFGRLRSAFDHATLLPPAFALHSYGGSWDFARDIDVCLNKRGVSCFFGFSFAVNGKRRLDRQMDLIRRLRDDSILIESDVEDAGRIDSDLVQAADLVARAKGWTFEDTLCICNRNAQKFIEHLS